ncbi:BrnT family toxin [Verminephrobacter aporrectodeae subsp. tuberculatae]|uniref:BrnT family toxin n=1 Tax=Verminephrobacter aporrectodeae TaxID=1110389 RepID=UPI002ADD533C|nr:BrnT family toxin [Verminephrobacter aporrectodeae]MCW8165941.1 BrnT family toxin [Verminephrobacter aporrectodeae subsp. tuberculatae]MCW8169999.1 BrnT family toxin [Verminephrobacter aporrectodeae subsp. tuberculatae]
MDVAFDPAKGAKNIEKHDGVSLADAKAFEWDGAVVWLDQRRAYDEDRMIGLGYIGERLFNVVFVERNGIRRIVSLRKANLREVKRYAQTEVPNDSSWRRGRCGHHRCGHV